MIVSTDLYNEHGLAFLVAPILPWTRPREELPTNIVLQDGEGGVPEQSVIFCTQIRTIAPWRLVRRVGELSIDRLRDLKYALRITFDLI